MDKLVWFAVAAASLVVIFLVWAAQGGRYPAGEKPEAADESDALRQEPPGPHRG